MSKSQPRREGRDDRDGNTDEEEGEEPAYGRLDTCPHDGCSEEYQTLSAMMKHRVKEHDWDPCKGPGNY